MRSIEDIMKEAAAVNASIDDLETALHDQKKRLAELHREAHRVVGSTFRSVGERKPKNMRKSGSVSIFSIEDGEPAELNGV